MTSYTKQHQYYCGVDLHARTMYVCIVNQADEIVYHREIPTKADLFLEKLAPYRDDVVVCVECIFTWYWVANLCVAEGILCVLGHESDSWLEDEKRPHRFEEDRQTVTRRHDSDGLRLSEGDALDTRSAAPPPAVWASALQSVDSYATDQ